MSYSWVGAPAVFNDSLPNGGDSSEFLLFRISGPMLILISQGQSQPVVPVWRPGIYHYLLVYGTHYDPRYWVPLFWSGSPMIWGCIASFSVVTIQWYIWGYSLAFSSTGTSGFISNLAHFGLRDVLGEPSPGSPLIPELLYSFYQLQFAATTGAIVTSAIAERGRLIPMMVFIFCWTILVYCPVAYWAWNVNGWAFKYGVLDYAGGTATFPQNLQPSTDKSRRPSRDLFGCLRFGLQHDIRKATAENDDQLPTSQRLFGSTRHDYPLVWLAWIQWRQCFWSES
jgi:Amt family ammonium transporter